MSLPPPPQDPQAHGSSGSSGFGPPQGFGPAPGGPAPQGQPVGGGFGPPGSGAGTGPGGGFPPPPGYGAPHGQPGFPGSQPYGIPPQPPGGGNRGAKVAAIVVGSVLAAAVAVGGVVLLVGGDGGSSRAEATGDHSPGAEEEPGAGAADPSGAPDVPAPGASEEPDSSLPTSPGQDLVPFVVLEPGQCFDHPALSSDVSLVETRSCDESHDGEVITNDTLSGTFADEQALRTKVMELCHSDVNTRLNSMPKDGRVYYYYAIYPALPTYQLGDDDTISCAITLSDTLDGPKLTAPLPD
ncbi:hypothetical protein E4198_21645 [Streptomyces sp. RKND-216]|uniref:hypothetical protein n=1 Tax=Streptomyces sp. RKND-216 TaxID=2562581 RepID=UPI00109DAE10|nr:hypothetical protein [Streptomyces sp. RKND-216]THA26917.1 hypothetical protein E4198_21645 [Streptomyces sp. RKND-216]